MKKLIKVVIIFITILGILNIAQYRTHAAETENTNKNETQQAEPKQTEEKEAETTKTEDVKKDKISLNKTKKTLYVGEKYTLKIKGTNKKAKWWKSSNTKKYN